MHKPAFFILLMFAIVLLPAFAENDPVASSMPMGQEGLTDDDGSVLIAAQGFAFQGKEFKTIKLGMKHRAPSSNNNESGTTAGEPDGLMALAGFQYVLKVVSYDDGKLAADVFRPGDFILDKKKKGRDKKKQLSLPVPVGHLAISRSQPNPGSFVFLGTLRLNDEETTVGGEFDLYLNDHSPQDFKKIKESLPDTPQADSQP